MPTITTLDTDRLRLRPFVETDLVDPRYVSPANVKTRLESYFQMMDQRRAAGVS